MNTKNKGNLEKDGSESDAAPHKGVIFLPATAEEFGIISSENYDGGLLNSTASSEIEVFSFSNLTPALFVNNSGLKVNADDVTDGACIRKGCENLAIKNSEWEDEYCSNECVVAHCSNVFQDWVAGNSKGPTNCLHNT